MADETKIVGLKITTDTGDSVNGVNRLKDASGSLLSGLTDLEGGVGLVTAAVGAMAAGLAAHGLTKYIEESTMLAARVETLGVVMQRVGLNAGYTSKEMDGFSAAIARQGITTEASRQAAVRMAQAHIDMTKSSDLARIAQDAAVIANTNSSDAFDRMTTGIATGQAIILHHMGLMVNFEGGYRDLAATLGKSTTELTESEKTQARVNEVMAAGLGIAGSYESAMGTAGKQIQSLSRYHTELKKEVGDVFLPATTKMIEDYTHALKGLYDLVKSHNDESGDSKGSTLSRVYDYIRLSGNQAVAQMDAVMVVYSRYKQMFGEVGGAISGKNGVNQLDRLFSEMAYQGGGEAERFQRDFWNRQDKINAFGAAGAYKGAVLDPKEAMLLQMAKDSKVKGPKTDTPDPKDDSADKTNEMYNAYIAGLDRFNHQIRELNPNLTDFDRKLSDIDETLEKQIEKFSGVTGVEKYVESLRAAAAQAKLAVQQDEERKNGAILPFSQDENSASYLNPLKQMSEGQQTQFDQSAMLQNWATKYADNLKQEEKEQFDHNNIMAGLYKDMSVKRLEDQERQSGNFQQSLLEQYDFQQMQDMLQLQWTLDHTALTEEQAERVRAQYRAKRRAADEQLGRDLTANEKNVQQARLTFASQATNAVLDITNNLVTLTGKKNKEMFILQKVAASANAIVNTAQGVTKALSSAAPPYNFVLAGLVAAAGAVQIATIASTDLGSSSSLNSTTPISGTGGGTPGSPVVTQPTGSQAQQPLNITVQVQGNVIGEDKWVEERLAPAIRDLAKNRNVDFGLAVTA